MTGSGTIGDPYVIWNVIDLQNMSLNLTAYYKLGQDIDASATSGWNGGAGFIPIGTWLAPFTGTLDGKSHIISSLYINRANNCGLFGYTQFAEIKNANLTNAAINVTWNQGGILIGEAIDTIVTNCHSSGQITAGGFAIGGLLGEIYGVTVDECSSSATVSGNYAVGGLIGGSMPPSVTSVITNSFATGTVSATSYTAGGFIGWADSCNITRCYSTGNVQSDEESIGGFAGQIISSDISQCFATGNVIGSYMIGGFVGYLDGGSSINDSYARGDVTPIGIGGHYDAGGFVGDNEDCLINRCYSTGLVSGSNAHGFSVYGTSYITNCFWDIQTSGTSHSDGGTGKTTEEMNHLPIFIAAGWDFTSIWNISRVSTVKSGNLTSGSAVLDGLLDLTIINEAYPFLRWQTVVELPCDCGFEWGETDAFGNLTPVDSKNTGESFAKALSGLEPQRTYYYRARASASPGPIHGGTKSFTTLVAIEVETLPATNITENSARIWGRVRKVPITAMARFDWGGNIEYGAETPWAQGLVSDDMFYHDLRNLAEGRAYHFRAMAMGSALVYGNDMTFTTRSPVGPVVLIQEELAHLMEVS